jgi:hypothetical protein
MALPGETVCREVAPCGDATWGEIPIDGDTQHVDASYAGMDSDGSAQRPWTTINAAVQAAIPGAVVAIAAGSYVEDVLVFDKPVKLWGRCPSMVLMTGTSAGLSTIDIRQGGDAAEVHTLAITGPKIGIGASGADHVIVDRVWVHDNQRAAIALERTLGAGSMSIDGSLIENVREAGVFSDSIDFDLSRSVIRDTVSGLAAPGRGINLQTSVHDHVATASISASLIERNTELAIFVYASKLTLEGTLVQDTRSSVAGLGGRALNIEVDPETGERSEVSVRASVFQRNMDIEVTCTGSDLTMESTTMRDTKPQPVDLLFGRGFSTADRAGRANVTLRESVITRCHDVGMVVDGSDVLLESVLIRDIAEQAAGKPHGRGLSVQYGRFTAARGAATARWSVIEGTREFGVTTIGSDLTLDATLVRNVSAISDGSFGDGVTLFTTDQPTNAWITGSRIEASVRAGISSFGGFAQIANTVLECNPIHMNGETFENKPASFEDAGGVVCGCAGITDSCAVRTVMLTPPEPLESQ